MSDKENNPKQRNSPHEREPVIDVVDDNTDEMKAVNTEHEDHNKERVDPLSSKRCQQEVSREDQPVSEEVYREEQAASTETKSDNVYESLQRPVDVIYMLRDINRVLVSAWEEQFKDYRGRVQISKGDIFHDAPSADAVVSPANSFGFMDGGIDMAYSMHFGWQMQKRLQEKIRNEHYGEVLVGDATIIRAMEENEPIPDTWSRCNGGKPIKYLISAPTMRVPLDVKDTANAYLAFRGVILAVQKHNLQNIDDPIRSVLCPGLGTAVGRMPENRCAYQMLQAFERYELGLHPSLTSPKDLTAVWTDHQNMQEYKQTIG